MIALVRLEHIIPLMLLSFILLYSRAITCARADKRKGRGKLVLPLWLKYILFLKEPNPFSWRTTIVQVALIVLTVTCFILIAIIPDYELRPKVAGTPLITVVLLCIFLRVERI